MQGRSLLPVLARTNAVATGARRCTTATTTTPAITTRARTTAFAPATHKLIHFWKTDQWELFDLVERSARAAQPVRTAGTGRADRDAQGASSEGARQAARDEDQLANESDPEWRGRAGREAAREVAVIRARATCNVEVRHVLRAHVRSASSHVLCYVRACWAPRRHARRHAGTSARRHVGTQARRHAGTSARSTQHGGTSARGTRHVEHVARSPLHAARVRSGADTTP